MWSYVISVGQTAGGRTTPLYRSHLPLHHTMTSPLIWGCSDLVSSKQCDKTTGQFSCTDGGRQRAGRQCV